MLEIILKNGKIIKPFRKVTELHCEVYDDKGKYLETRRVENLSRYLSPKDDEKYGPLKIETKLFTIFNIDILTKFYLIPRENIEAITYSLLTNKDEIETRLMMESI